MISFNKDEIRESLDIHNIFELLNEWGGNPVYTPFGIISATICHNPPGEGSKKLYYYENSGLFRCYTGCDASFDIFELVIKVMNIQQHLIMNLNDAVQWVAQRFGISGTITVSNDSIEELEDWKFLANYERIQNIELQINNIVLKEYDSSILQHFNYNVKLLPWLNEGISQQVLNNAMIGFYPGADVITIPHFDINNRLIGVRGRTLVQDEAELYGKYKPLRINDTLYNHPLGMNLYNLNHSLANIERMRRVIVFEGEKSALKYWTYFGEEGDISVACCGSSISTYQMQLLINARVQEVIIAFDRQFKEVGDNEFQHLKNNLLRLRQKYKNYLTISFIVDTKKLTDYKDSPIDKGKDIFLKLFKERVIL